MNIVNIHYYYICSGCPTGKLFFWPQLAPGPNWPLAPKRPLMTIFFCILTVVGIFFYEFGYGWKALTSCRRGGSLPKTKIYVFFDFAIIKKEAKLLFLIQIAKTL
jgi:hypothetical protein